VDSFSLHILPQYEGVSKSFQTQSIRKYTLTRINIRWEATQRVMLAELTRLTHKIAIQPHLVAESCTIRSSRSRRPVRKLLDTPSYTLSSNGQNVSFTFMLATYIRCCDSKELLRLASRTLCRGYVAFPRCIICCLCATLGSKGDGPELMNIIMFLVASLWWAFVWTSGSEMFSYVMKCPFGTHFLNGLSSLEEMRTTTGKM
jgi:hypothetical protein